ncbi:MAG: PilZ domain-containing protein [Nitrospirales bacterium]|nr:PilZ domain-containing protein [Nitrospirales bacterium]
MISNQREFIRVKVVIHVELRVGGNVVIPGKIDNISLNGLLICTDSIVPDQTPCLVRIHLDGGTGGPTIEANGQVVRAGSGKLAVQFSEILGTEGMSHLQNLILYNSGHQVDQAEAEFQSHLGLKANS